MCKVVPSEEWASIEEGRRHCRDRYNALVNDSLDSAIFNVPTKGFRTPSSGHVELNIIIPGIYVSL